MRNLFRTELSKIDDSNKILIESSADWDVAEFFTLNSYKAEYLDKNVDKNIPFGIYVKYAGFKKYFYIIIPNGNSTYQVYKVSPGKNDTQTESIILNLFNYIKNKN